MHYFTNPDAPRRPVTSLSPMEGRRAASIPAGRPTPRWRSVALLLVLLGLTATTSGVGEPKRPFTAPVRTTPDGKLVRWDGPVSLVVDATVEELLPGATDSVTIAAAAWSATGVLPTLSVSAGRGLVAGYDPNGPNASVLVLGVESLGVEARSAIAVTVATFDAAGRILDADVLLNTAMYRFERPDSTTAPGEEQLARAGYDLRSVVTHELGHVLGLGEDREDPDTTMFVKTRSHDYSKRSLRPPDVAAISALYEAPHGAEPAGVTGCAVPFVRPAQTTRRTWKSPGVPKEAARSRWQGGFIVTDVEGATSGSPMLGGTVGEHTQVIFVQAAENLAPF